jgi:hypothetical protein
MVRFAYEPIHADLIKMSKNLDIVRIRTFKKELNEVKGSIKQLFKVSLDVLKIMSRDFLSDLMTEKNATIAIG